MLKNYKNILILFLLKLHDFIFSRKNSPSSPQNILVISTTALGDTLWATPFLRSLRKSFPEAQVSVLTSTIGEQVLKLNPWIDTLHVTPPFTPLAFWKLLKTLRQSAYDTVFILHASQRWVYPLAYLTQAGRILGTKGLNKGLDFILTQSNEPVGKHQIQRRLELLQLVGGSVLETKMELFLDPSSENKALSWLQEKHLDSSSLIGLHPGSSHIGTQWPTKHYKTLLQKLSKEFQCPIIVSGSKKEQKLVEFICEEVEQAIPLIGDLDIRSFAALVKRYSLFITNDTGPLHVATACETPTIGIFASSLSSETGPFKAPTTRVIQKEKTCLPCLKKRCQEPFCLLQISPDEVLKLAKARTKSE